MRIKTIITTLTAVSALLTLTTACGGDGSQADALGGDPFAANGKAPENGTAFQKLPKAGSMAAAARLVNGYTKCDQVSTSPGEDGPSEDAKLGPAYTVTETGYCGRRNGTTIVMYKDPKAFQTAFKAEMEKNGGGNPNSGIVVGRDFAVGSRSADAMAALLQPQAGLLMLNCHAGFNPPSGFRKEPALIKGCVLTDYYKD
ncbi:hypothetical protein [Streptomyces sp. NPDC001594]|uniref:hypothetical protein n=1 Tax=Streptomyces sp. NPDC001594 TaxID=3364590 RepID=UPI00369839DF